MMAGGTSAAAIRFAPTAKAAAFTVSLLVLLGGCGGDAPTLTKAQFSDKANKLCRQTSAQRERQVAKAVELIPPAEAEYVSALEGVVLAGIGSYEEATRLLGELAAPDGDEDQVERLLQRREEAAVKVREAPATALFSKYPFRKADELQEEYGLDKCKS